jgi:cell division protein FtsL
MNNLMSDHLKFLKPFISITFIVLTLFGLVFLQMEERRISYSVLKLTREYKKELQKLKVKEIEVAHAFRPQHVEMIARGRLTMKKILPSQIIRLTPNYALNENKNN